MKKKYGALLLILVSLTGISACSYFIQENKFDNTVWKSQKSDDGIDENVLELQIYSKNRIRAIYGKKKMEYIYYFDQNQIKVTNIEDYSQSLLRFENKKLIADPNYFGVESDKQAQTIVLERVLSDSSTSDKNTK